MVAPLWTINALLATFVFREAFPSVNPARQLQDSTVPAAYGHLARSPLAPASNPCCHASRSCCSLGISLPFPWGALFLFFVFRFRLFAAGEVRQFLHLVHHFFS